MSGASGSDRGESFHLYLHRNLPLYLYNCILVAGFDKPHVFTSLMEPAAVSKMEEYVRNCVVPALTSREERQRYVGLFADKPQLFQISPGHRIQLMMLVRECRNNKPSTSNSSDSGIPISPVSNTAFTTELVGDSFRRRLSENEASLSSPRPKQQHLAAAAAVGAVSSSYSGVKRKLGDSGPPVVSSVPVLGVRVSQGLQLQPYSSPQPQHHRQSPQEHQHHHSSSQQAQQQQPQNPTARGVGYGSDDTSSSTGVSIESDLVGRSAFQPGNNTTLYASPISVEEHERRILRLLERWFRAQPDPVIQNLRRDIDFHLTVTRQVENDVVTAKVVCLRCKKSVALVGRGDTWVLSNYHRHLRSCLSNERHLNIMAASALGREDVTQPVNLLHKSPDPYNLKADCSSFDVSAVREEAVVEAGSSGQPPNEAGGPLILSRVDVSSGRLCNSLQKYEQYPMKTESMASDLSVVGDDSESENGISSAATPRDQEIVDESSAT